MFRWTWEKNAAYPVAIYLGLFSKNSAVPSIAKPLRKTVEYELYRSVAKKGRSWQLNNNKNVLSCFPICGFKTLSWFATRSAILGNYRSKLVSTVYRKIFRILRDKQFCLSFVTLLPETRTVGCTGKPGGSHVRSRVMSCWICGVWKRKTWVQIPRNIFWNAAYTGKREWTRS